MEIKKKWELNAKVSKDEYTKMYNTSINENDIYASYPNPL